MRYIASVLLISVGVSGCAFYRPQPLPLSPNEAPSIAALAQHPLTLSEVAALAVQRSPDLLAERGKAGVAEAQAHASGLLPDPQFSASADHPTVQGAELVNGYVLQLAQDLQTLLTEPSRAASAKAKKKQAQLDLVWAEWQTIQNAASLYVQKVYGEQKTKILGQTADVLLTQSDRSQRALKMRNTTVEVAGSDLSAALDLASQRDAAKRAALTADADLKMQLNLTSNATFFLADPGLPEPVTQSELESALANVARIRPDLLALQAGYHAQEEAVRTAILEQFPAINVGFSRASDTSNIQTNGLSVTFNIPIFGSTQAKIRVERATRAQLRAEYQTRLDQTSTDAWRIWHVLNLLRSQVDQLQESVPELRSMAQQAQKAYKAGNIAPATYVLLQTSLGAREGELLDLKATLWSDTIALRALLGMSPLIPNKEPLA